MQKGKHKLDKAVEMLISSYVQGQLLELSRITLVT